MTVKYCANVECSFVKNTKGSVCPECGSNSMELGFKEANKLITAKKKYPNDPIKYKDYKPIAKRRNKPAKTEQQKDLESQMVEKILKTSIIGFAAIGGFLGIFVGFIIGFIVGIFAGAFVGLMIGLFTVFLYKIIKH